MKRIQKPFPLTSMKSLFFTLLIPVILTTGCKKQTDNVDAAKDSDSTPRQTITLNDEVLNNADLEFAEARPAEISDVVSAFGEITLNNDKVASVVSKVEGEMVEGLKQLGDQVKAGEIIARIESHSLAASIVQYLQTEHDRQFTMDAYLREKELFSKKLTSSTEFYAAEQAYRRAQIEHAAALQPLELLNFTEGQLHGYLNAPNEAKLTILEVVSPIDGIVTKRSIIKGQAVQGDTELYVLADLSEVWIDFQVPLAAANEISPGDSVKVNVSGGAVTGNATIKYVAPLANEINRTVQVRASMPNTNNVWRPGSPVGVEFAREKSKAEVAIPSDALLDFESGFAVFVRKDSHTFELRKVKPGQRDNTMAAIDMGLATGETVVSTNAFLLKAQWQMETGN
jgi:membrane fusion protein, heavy metal efflux system